jgi:endogenous inhibitor of DNA gyrase (YacG/DUF329 family)
MNDQKIDLICPKCGQAFSTFLSEMAEHNAKVTCPTCGNSCVFDSKVESAQQTKPTRHS